MEQSLDLTPRQFSHAWQKVLLVLKRENGQETGSSGENNALAMDALAKLLRKKTGRTRFELGELLDPTETLRRHEETQRLEREKNPWRRLAR